MEKHIFAILIAKQESIILIFKEKLHCTSYLYRVRIDQLLIWEIFNSYEWILFVRRVHKSSRIHSEWITVRLMAIKCFIWIVLLRFKKTTMILSINVISGSISRHIRRNLLCLSSILYCRRLILLRNELLTVKVETIREAPTVLNLVSSLDHWRDLISLINRSSIDVFLG
jgi:hypothetical protein